MADLQDSSCASAKGISAELKDDFYSTLVDDFLGAHYGDLLELDGQSWKNRMLIQIGLLREEQDVPWTDLIKWVQKIIPMFKTADFRGLIERNTVTALTLNGEARQSFLDKDANFEFVGPVCDGIGIGRRDLLEMSDFSDRGKLTGLTNGLVLELTNFISREKLDPVVLVSWIRNFEPLFCTDGKIHKANKQLQAGLRHFRTQYRSNLRNRKRDRGLLEQFLQSPFNMNPEDEVENQRRTSTRGNLKRKQSNPIQKTAVKDEDEKFKSSDMDVTDKLSHRLEPKRIHQHHGVKRELGSNNHQPPTSPVQDEEEDSNGNDTGDNVTLLDVSVLSWQKMADVCGEKKEAAKAVSLELLKNHFNAMLKNDRNLQSLEENIKASPHQLVPPLEFLCYMCQFFFELIDIIEQQIISFEKDIMNSTGERLGRDRLQRFQNLLNFDESAVTRYVHMASKMFSPSVGTSLNYRRHWLAFCLERDNISVLPVHESNRIINYFEAAAGIIHHREEFALFVSDLQSIDDKTNVLLESISADANDETLQMLVCVVAVIYLKVLGPLWQLLKSDGEYSLFSKYILCLYDKLLEWSQDASNLLQPDAFVNVFLQVPMQEAVFKGVFQFCREISEKLYGSLLSGCLQRMMKAITAVMEDSLKDFLPGGKHCKDLAADVTAKMDNSTFSLLMGEYPFGHAYPYENKRPDKSLGQTEGWASQETWQESVSKTKLTNSTFPLATSSPSEAQPDAPKVHTICGPNFSLPTKLKESQLKQQSQDQIIKKRILGIVTKYGGPCKTKQDVEELLKKLDGSSQTEIREVISSELIYRKSIMCSKDSKLDKISMPLSSMISKLKDVLPNEVLVATPSENVVGCAEVEQRSNETLPSETQGSSASHESQQLVES